MIKFFRKIRKNLLNEGKTTRYLLYAVGEIVLVVIGILIALQINNQNDLRKERLKELHYLENIKVDLRINISEMNSYIADRSEMISAAKRILSYFEGKPLTDLDAFNADGFSVYSWQKFYQSDNTFQELVNSGNLAILTNDAIKTGLLNLETLNKKMTAEEAHFRFDTETNLYKPIYASMDLNLLVNNAEYYLSKGQSGTKTVLPDNYFNNYLKTIHIKNGFVLTVLEFNTLNEQMREIIKRSNLLIDLIDKELKTHQ